MASVVFRNTQRSTVQIIIYIFRVILVQVLIHVIMRKMGILNIKMLNISFNDSRYHNDNVNQSQT